MIRIKREEQSDVFRITSDEGYLTFDLFDLNKESNKLFDDLLRSGWAIGVNCGTNVTENIPNKILYSKFRKAAGLIATPWPL